jgi:hypothetical protein
VWLSALLAVLLLVWPELSELGIPGFVSLKRRLSDNERRAHEQQERQDRLDQQLSIYQTRLDNLAAATSSAHATIGDIYIGTDELRRARENLEEKERRFRTGTPPEPTSHSMRASLPNEAVLASRLLRAWEQLSESLQLRGVPPMKAESDSRDGSLQAELSRLRSDFGPEIQIVRAARNAVAHARPLSQQELMDAVSLAEDLNELVQSVYQQYGRVG